MKKFQFNLQRLLTYKEQLLDGEMMNLAVLQNMLQTAEQNLQQLQKERTDSRNQFNEQMQNGLQPAEIGIYNSYEKRINELIKTEICTVNELENKIVHQIERIKNLKMETRSLETIKEARYEEYRAEQLKKEELFIEEFVAGRKIAERR